MSDFSIFDYLASYFSIFDYHISGERSALKGLGSQRFLVNFNGITKVTWTDYDYVVFRLALYFRYSCGNIDFDDNSYAVSKRKSSIKSCLIELNKDYQNDNETSMLESFVNEYQQHLDRIIEVCDEEGLTELLSVILNLTKDFPRNQSDFKLGCDLLCC